MCPAPSSFFLFSVLFPRVVTFSSRLPFSAFPFRSHSLLRLFLIIFTVDSRGLDSSSSLFLLHSPFVLRFFLCACYFFFSLFFFLYLPSIAYLHFLLSCLSLCPRVSLSCVRQTKAFALWDIKQQARTHKKNGKRERKKKVRIYFTYMAKISA